MTQQSNTMVDVTATAGSGLVTVQVNSLVDGGHINLSGGVSGLCSTGPSTCPICQRMYFNAAFQQGIVLTGSSAPLDAQFPHLCFREGLCATRECPICHWMVPGGRVHSQEECEQLQSLVSPSARAMAEPAMAAGEPPSAPPAETTGELAMSDRRIRRFVLTWDHAKITRHPDKYRVEAVEGVLFTSGHVVIDVPALFGNSSCFASMEQLTGYYAKRGTVIVEWMDNDDA